MRIRQKLQNCRASSIQLVFALLQPLLVGAVNPRCVLQVPALVVLVSSFNEQAHRVSEQLSCVSRSSFKDRPQYKNQRHPIWQDSEEFTEAQVAQAQGSLRLRHAGLASTLLGGGGGREGLLQKYNQCRNSSKSNTSHACTLKPLQSRQLVAAPTY